MEVFSRRNGYNSEGIELECASEELRKRIFNCFYKEEYNQNLAFLISKTTGIEDMMIEMGVTYEYPENQIVHQKNANALLSHLLVFDKWYRIFDFIERYLRICNNEKAQRIQIEFNRILEDEVSPYRIIDLKVVPITNQAELATIQEAKRTKYKAVNVHISKALELYANRQKPDYENSIKESISAVESMCCIITGLSGKDATLGKTIKKLKDNGINSHPSLEKAFSSMYGYTSDEDGIRHGSIDFMNAPAEDAKYMLITCSAFVNYLIEKWSKAQRNIT